MSGGELKRIGVFSLFFGMALAVGAAPPIPLVPGIHPVSNTEVLFCLEAPGKKTVNVVGDFNQWTPSAQSQMTQEGDKFWITIGNLTPGKEYIFQYWIDDGIKTGDPYSDKVVDFAPDKQITSEGTYPGLIAYTREFDGPASVFTAGLPPAPQAPVPFVKPAPENLLIYETLVRDFVKTHSFKEMRDSLDYFKRLGVNAIELMPVMEFEGNDGWGYSTTYFCAVDKYYGPAEDLRSLIQAAHEQGLAVILDIVMNDAMGQSPLVQMYWDKAAGKPSMDSPYANQTAHHPYSVGFDLNYESTYTRSYFKRVLQHWLTDYHADGFRFDLSKGLTQKITTNPTDWGKFDQSRIDILSDLAGAARQADPSAYLILEHFGDNDEETVLSAKGFLLWGNSSFDHGYAEIGDIGHNFAWAYYKSHNWAENHLVAYMESHDEERIVSKALQNGFSSGTYNVKDLNTALERAKMTALFLLGVPGPKMIWQFGEYGDSRERGTTPEERMGRKPLPDEWRGDASRIKLWNTNANLLHFRGRYQDAFKSGTFSWKPEGAVRTWKLNHADLNAFAVGNFGVTSDKVTPNLSGTWYDYFSYEKFTLSAATEIQLQPGEFHLFTDRPIFAEKASLSAFPVPGSLNPTKVAVGIRAGAVARTGTEGRRARIGEIIHRVFQDGQGGARNIQGRNETVRP